MDPAEYRRAVMAQAESTEEEVEARKAEARRFLYQDVESLISTGFLAHTLEVSGVAISLRSLCPGDLFLLNHRTVNSSAWKLWFIASSIWMVDGLNLLPHPASITKIYENVQALPRTTQNILFSLSVGLLNRVNKAVWRTEAYCYEDYSRMQWRLSGRQNPTQESVSGIPGSNRLGANYAQRMWMAFNLAEDDRIRHIQEWQAAKLVASAMSPKGIKKLNQSDDNLRKSEDRRRREAVERMVYETLYGEGAPQEPGDMVVVVRGQPVQVPRVKRAHSAEDLAEEMRKWVAGEKDWHDIVVDTYKNRIREQFEQEKQKREQALEKVQEAGTTSTTAMVGYTLDQIREFRPDLVAAKSGGRKVFDGSVPGSLYQKYVAEEAASGRLHADDGGIHEGATPERESLQNQVAGRKPAFSAMTPGDKD